MFRWGAERWIETIWNSTFFSTQQMFDLRLCPHACWPAWYFIKAKARKLQLKRTEWIPEGNKYLLNQTHVVMFTAHTCRNPALTRSALSLLFDAWRVFLVSSLNVYLDFVGKDPFVRHSLGPRRLFPTLVSYEKQSRHRGRLKLIRWC